MNKFRRLRKSKPEPRSDYLEPAEQEQATMEQANLEYEQRVASLPPEAPKRPYMYKHRKKRDFRGLLTVLSIFAIVVAMYVFWGRGNNTVVLPNLLPTPAGPQAGDVIAEDKPLNFTLDQTTQIARQNYGGTAQPITTAVTKINYEFRSQLPSGEFITIHARAYLPQNPRTNLPIFAFATGTTGIGDQCSPSLEDPAKANWANYDSHMTMYASRGYAVVTPDYEGHRDPNRIHHYMVGELEGRVLLDSIRALRKLASTKDRLNSSTVFLSGYSQGGHAAFWADKIASSYAADVKPLGVLGFGPVMSVKRTLTDVTRAANINWFGPYVLFSYRDYYRTDYGQILIPHWDETLATDVPGHCIDTNIPFWGRSPAEVYTPEFIAAMSADKLAESYPVLDRDLEKNEVTPITTNTAKRINQGELDNVVLPGQQQAVMPELCRTSRGSVQLVVYPHANHYDTMAKSFADTIGWMKALEKGEKPPTTCS